MGKSGYSNGNLRGWILVIIAVLLVAAAGAAVYSLVVKKAGAGGHRQALVEVKSSKDIKNNYDVIVVGTDPEGVAAAVSAARNGLKTLLVETRNRDVLGGLLTEGWLNSIDMNYEPTKNLISKHDIMNKGIFSEWYGKIEGDSFDVTTAANAFYELVSKEKNIDLLMKAKAVDPITAAAGGAAKVSGVTVTKADGSKQAIQANSVIDATQDGDIAAAAGVPFTTGREDLADPKSRMAVTAVFRLNNITPERWKQFGKTIAAEDKGQGKYGINEKSLWGFDKMQEYPAVNKERVRMRGLNGGLQNDNTMLVNALQIFNIDPFDPKSREEARKIAEDELPHVLAYLKQQYAEFEGVELAGIAPELYVRESRHMQGEYRLSIIDLLENRDQWDRIAFGGYPVDIQRTSPKDNGAVVIDPDKYAVPFRSLVPLKVDGLLVVGRAASYDTLPHGSARVVPVGMAEGEAAGAAAKLAQEQNATFRQMSASKETIAKLQDILNKQGMDLKPFAIKAAPYMEHKSYAGLKTAITLGLSTGGYKNEFELDKPSNQQRMVNVLEGMRKFNPAAMAGSAAAVISGVKEPQKQPVSLDSAAQMIASLLKQNIPQGKFVEGLQATGFISKATVDSISNKQELTNGDAYMLINDVYKQLKTAK
ncbi:FAD-dependent oxidoreductase [Paenibacillus radicis (ex Xue et al. 2023)]|uniref:FAD-dependent oxidoreductase n=1 Tax=Paenibacillus radicis (ex Xue et al. 2023) TaxID=2972489 RepID=A0ABT1YQ28_9BACL|nr:FAD-dependent oxidoreductase [Paenibacillus radicis (ex Xue et al. 2023)]MCR8634095.1 FAD-dependent oxidoreductase [Paenibacillus radicis (ex Xue et al. 2023)]